MAPASENKQKPKALEKNPRGDLICARKTLFDRKKVSSQIADLAEKRADDAAFRREVAQYLSNIYDSGRLRLAETYREKPFETAALTRSYTYLTDEVVLAALRTAVDYLHPMPNPTEAQSIAVMAVGGYGRGKMAPYSDVDLLFLSPYKLSPWTESVVESMLYILWDMRLKVGHATRTVGDCIRLAKADQTIRTALLECRYIGGDKRLAKELEAKFWKSVIKGSEAEFIELKLAEREERHLKQGGQRYMQEPNVKEGKGGLRDLQSLFWITKYISGATRPDEMIDRGYFTKAEYEEFAEAEDFLWTVRCHLHLISGRATEKLGFEAQPEIAAILGYQDHEGLLAVEQFMQTYFRHATHVGDLTRIFLTKLEANHVKRLPNIGRRLINAMPWIRDNTPEGYTIIHGRLSFEDEAEFLSDPLNMLRLFEQALKSEVLIHPDAMRVIASNLDLIDDKVRNSPEAQRIFMDLLLLYSNPERALRRMNELGVLGQFIPEFQRVVALMQFNMYHQYTVDEHIIQCISILADLEMGKMKEEFPIASGILAAGINRRVLYVALLLHDIGKGRPEDHSLVGAEIAEVVAPRLGLNEKESETVVWLVKNHLLMSDTAQKRDNSDPRTVQDFCRVVNTMSRLKMLTVLTVCDIMGVGPGTLNNWKAQLLKSLYKSAKSVLQDGSDKAGSKERVEEAKQKLLKRLSGGDGWAEPEIQAELERHYDTYWQGLDSKTHAVFARLLKGIKATDFAADLQADDDRAATRACFVLQDHPGIFSRLAGALALARANVVDARTYTSVDGYATAAFWIQDLNHKPFEAARLPRLRETIVKTLKGEVIATEAIKDKDKIKKREREFVVPTEITFDNGGSEIYTIIEVDTRDRPGLLFDLTRTLSRNNIYIASAVIATYGVQAVDVFYVKDMFGLKLHSDAKRKTLEKKLLEAIDRGALEALS